MKLQLLLAPLLLLSTAALVPQEAESSEQQLRVFLLVGQSNMVGAGEVVAREDRNGGRGSLEHLATDGATAERFGHLLGEDGAWVERDDVWISYFEREGRLAPGYGSREDTIGPELGFGHVVGEHFEDPVLLVKVAWGGRSLAVDFRPPSAGGEVGATYTEFVAQAKDVLGSIERRFPELEYDGVELAGFGWHQGWNDRIDDEFNAAYEENLACFIRDVRAEFEAPGLPFVIAETGMSGRGETHPRALSLMTAQAAVAEREEFVGNVAFVGTRDFFRPAEESPSDQAYHWNNNAETYWCIGEGMGQAMLGLLDSGDAERE